MGILTTSLRTGLRMTRCRGQRVKLEFEKEHALVSQRMFFIFFG